MNRLTFILGMAAGLCSLAACTGADEAPGADGGDTGSLETLATEVPIRLGVSAQAEVTRGNGPITAFSHTDVGLFCIATGSFAEGSAAPAWGSEAFSAAPYNQTLWWNNTQGTIDGETLTWGNDFTADDARRHYPSTQYAYSFYSYYPYSSQPSVTDSRVTVSYQLDGTDDVLWAQASSDDAHAYSARYYRDGGSETPQLSYKHLLMALHLQLEAHAYGEDDGTIFVESIKLKELPAKASLVVASKDKTEEGTLIADWSNTWTYSKDYADKALWFKETANDLGIDLLLPAATDGHAYELEVTYYDYEMDEDFLNMEKVTWTWTAKLIEPASGWQPGITYTLSLPLKTQAETAAKTHTLTTE